MTTKKLLSQYHPILYFLSVWEKRLRRMFVWYFGKAKFSSIKQIDKLQFRVKKHQSKLLKKLGDSDMQLQYNKIDNLKIVVQELNGTLIYPGETFSFCKLVGLPSKRRGFKLGMEISYGKAQAGIGGGICQASNLIYWLVLHSPLTVIERRHHSFDPFPDDGRVLPFASGATVFYNYIDLQFKNNTSHTFQLNLWLTDKTLDGEIRIDKELDYAYHVYEENHAFFNENGQWYRCNELWRNKIAKFEGGKILAKELIVKNLAKVMYTPSIHTKG